jgi:gamma-glutamylaminecyclotransferase
MNARVFVYGTLKRGFGNHRLLARAALVGEATIRGSMHDLGAFPAVAIDGKAGTVHGELFDVDSPTMERLDRLEGTPHFYQRKLVHTSAGEAWVYVMASAKLAGRPVVSGGRWLAA